MSTTETQTVTEAWVNYHDAGEPGRRRALIGKAAKQTFNQVPCVGFQRIASSNPEDRNDLWKETGATCRGTGFFYAVNYSVDEELL